ncbi:MAG: hypothetical protein A3B91_02065 [Candidatus Yanofskybacteria bacterium RIFCSPHIGHO2_02_FULL_41_29]|uniref:Uncharacterized protein n=1 Tax=Candidatus Yanofskybacteria bacterium RIFCSPHIGHO2_01_FULL_41_53 TaxID=1802663 RepID=A0A1F8EFV6_9BACT|nr:MAG: hypothetical protein A2650_01345 [Candidatus Yanofskybacteria bacterium RIFCSPHIGHO2_01_FULL_41_53]OGN10518.1 MAG: hypothetical protein A3B91_02065 [Candidatus Yanofskybacteria bacterium RIFCSPHIGHO2_02_FULL_41_29]OGN18914.1 MAG: hypothetical protein A3F48_02635 [Candidatus Yanofskybacteria bacterium RIFCSPHIGHO2_12_FULL_41_9]OGN21505.1 MAG: hypothetical protein A2916_01695 [Candidatus Yanofskybacteria bacterium RIFCSPLOWO2_01_FULL_41_67]OGN28479.1 MAG: hypothetical protein A3H54_04415 
MQGDILSQSSAGFNNLIQTIRLIVTPSLLAVPAVVIWHYLYINGWHSTSRADEPIVNAILPGLFGAHVFIAGLMIIRESDDIRKMKRAIRETDKEAFIEIAEDSIPLPMKYILFITANLIQAWTISLNYEVYWTGLASVFSIAYMLALIWEIIADFDDPVNGMWVIKGVPAEWIKEAKIKRRISDRFVEWLIRKMR